MTTGDVDTADRSETIGLIRDSAAAIAPPGGDLRRVRALRFGNSGLGYDPAVLARIGALGWIGLMLPEESGGAGLGMSATCGLIEELGRGLVPEPLIGASLAAALLDGGAKPDLLARVLRGAAYLPLAWQELPDTLAAPGTPDASRIFVPMGGGAEAYLVPVQDGAGSLHLHLCPAADASVATAATQDGGHYATISPKRSFAAGERIASDIEARLALALDRAALATAAYLLGVMEAAFALTVAYLKTRSQFGRPIGSFQVLQHRAADLKIQVALTRASVESAAARLDAGASDRGRAVAVSQAKARASEAAMLVTRQAIQLHGGIGYTDEYDAGLYLRKSMVLANRYGSARFHRARFMAQAPTEDEP